MIIVIIAGGSGTRLWPLSTPDYPKHLIKFGDMSLLQQAYARATSVASKVYVVTEVGQVHHVKQQLPDLTDEAFIIEPARRGTASCIVATLLQIQRENDPDEPVAFMPADHYIRDVAGFKRSFTTAANTSRAENRLVLVGVEPSYAATGFGYIEKGDVLNEEALTFNVKSFKEKPDYITAAQYVESGNYLWNAGYFVASVNTFKQAMEQFAPALCKEYEALAAASPEGYEAVYLDFENISIDYALIEKVQNLLVVQASFDWMDLGTYADLHKAVSTDEAGNHTHGRIELEEVSNSFIQNHEDKPVAIVGLDGVVVVNTSQGLLVTRADLSQKVGDVSKRFQQKG